MKILIMPNLKLQNAAECARRVISILLEEGLTPAVDTVTADALGPTGAETGRLIDLFQACDIVAAIGGDGTIFHCAVDAVRYNKPILGINSGRLGFLSQMEAGDLSLLSNLKTKNYIISARMLLEVEVHRRGGDEVRYALDDGVLCRSHLGRIIDMEVSCDSSVVGVYRADGIIFSTPTGSTAYSLSAGGPIIDPGLECIVMTPTCPHSLNNRSVVFAPLKTIEVRSTMPGKHEKLFVVVDGANLEPVDQGESVTIGKSQKVSRFISFQEQDFYQTLKEKLRSRG